MSKKQMLQIQNKGAILQVLGCLFKNPTILLDSNYYISPEDFPETFHSLIFSSINNLFANKTVVMDIPTICNYLSTMPTQYEIFKMNNGTEFIELVSESADLENFQSNYETMKKFSVLRDFCSSGIDITDIFDYNETEPKRIEKMNERVFTMSTSDIINHYMIKFNDIASKHEMEDIGITKSKGADRVREVLLSFRESPDLGMRLYNEWYNTAFRGARLRKFYLETAGSGTGKSRRQIREAVFMSVPYLYDSKKSEWVHTGVIPVKTTYICTELEEDEILPIAIAFLSEVDEEKIKLNELSLDEENRVNKAIELMEEYDFFHFVTISDFDIEDIQKIILDKILKENCQYFFFDYIHSTAKSLSYYGRKTGVKLQEHQILFLMAVSLKAICQKYNIFLYSATQVNGGGMSGEVRDEQALRGSKAIADKIDAGIVLTRISEEDKEKLKEILENNFGKTPTHCTAIYKNRGGRVRGIYLWSLFDLGTMREEFLFATDEAYAPITFKFLQFEMVEEVEEEEFEGIEEVF